MNPLKTLFGRGDVGPRPDLAEFAGVPPGPRMLVVDAATPPAGYRFADELQGTVHLQHEAGGTVGVPIREDDGRRLPATPGGWERIVLLDVVDGVQQPAFALSAAAEALAPDGRLVLIQQVAPDDVDARGAWNALQRFRDARHTWTPNRRQVRALAGDAGFVRETEALWEEPECQTVGVRAGTERLLRLYVQALTTSGLVEEGETTVRRLGLVLRRR